MYILPKGAGATDSVTEFLTRAGGAQRAGQVAGGGAEGVEPGASAAIGGGVCGGDRLVILLLSGSGLRTGELCQLEVREWTWSGRQWKCGAERGIGHGLSRNAIYERVRGHGRQARIENRVSPHRLRHTFATHLIQAGVGLVTVRDLLGHQQITSTQIYIHLTARDLRQAAERHPVGKLIARMEELLPHVKRPFQGGGLERRFG